MRKQTDPSLCNNPIMKNHVDLGNPFSEQNHLSIEEDWKDIEPRRHSRYRFIRHGSDDRQEVPNPVKSDSHVSSGLDRDLVNYMRATGIPNDGTLYYRGTPQETTGADLWKSVSDLIENLKTAGIWDASVAIYPYVGGTEQCHKINLKSPYNLNSAKRLIFHDAWKHSSTGATPTTKHSRADTLIRLSDDLPQYSFTGATYFQSIAIPLEGEFHPFATIGSEKGRSDVSMSVNAQGVCKATAGTATVSFQGSETHETYTGLLTMTCFRDNVLRLYRNDTLLSCSDLSKRFYFDNPRPMDSNATLYLCAGGVGGVSPSRLPMECERSFDYFGWGMDTAQQSALNEAVAVFQSALHRKV